VKGGAAEDNLPPRILPNKPVILGISGGFSTFLAYRLPLFFLFTTNSDEKADKSDP